MPEAWRASLTLNAGLMASTAIPAFLLTRAVVGRRLPAYLVAVMVVSIPWMVQAANLLTEATAYAAFVWAMWAWHRALVRKTVGADTLAVSIFALAYLARTQFVVLDPMGRSTWRVDCRGCWPDAPRGGLSGRREGSG